MSGLNVFDLPGIGISCNGTSGLQMSGNDVTNSNLLGNISGNVSYTYCNDHHIAYDQMGLDGSNVAAYGIILNHSSAGQVNNNFVWNNTVNVQIDGSNYEWFSDNRLTDLRQVNINLMNGQFLTVTGNQIYSASQASVGTYNQMVVSNVQQSTVSQNIFFDWRGADLSPYSITIDAASSSLNVLGNIFRNYKICGVQLPSSAFEVVLNDNQPSASSSHRCAASPRSGRITPSP